VYVRFADLRGLLDNAGLGMREVAGTNAKMAGRKLSEISGAKNIIDQAIDWHSPTLNGFSDEARAEVDDLVIQRFERGQFRASLANLWNVARTL
jgi:hypothetical protein